MPRPIVLVEPADSLRASEAEPGSPSSKASTLLRAPSGAGKAAVANHLVVRSKTSEGSSSEYDSDAEAMCGDTGDENSDAHVDADVESLDDPSFNFRVMGKFANLEPRTITPPRPRLPAVQSPRFVTANARPPPNYRPQPPSRNASPVRPILRPSTPAAPAEPAPEEPALTPRARTMGGKLVARLRRKPARKVTPPRKRPDVGTQLPRWRTISGTPPPPNARPRARPLGAAHGRPKGLPMYDALERLCETVARRAPHFDEETSSVRSARVARMEAGLIRQLTNTRMTALEAIDSGSSGAGSRCSREKISPAARWSRRTSSAREAMSLMHKRLSGLRV